MLIRCLCRLLSNWRSLLFKIVCHKSKRVWCRVASPRSSGQITHEDSWRRNLRSEGHLEHTRPLWRRRLCLLWRLHWTLFCVEGLGRLLTPSLKPPLQRCCYLTCLVGEPPPQMYYVKKIVNFWVSFVFFGFRKPSAKALLQMKGFFAFWTCKYMFYQGLPIFYTLFCYLLSLTQGFYICFQKRKACKWPCNCCRISCFQSLFLIGLRRWPHTVYVWVHVQRWWNLVYLQIV
jgi:hypothetical protein